MKIILQAFDKLRSAPMDVPENTTSIFDMELFQPSEAIKNDVGGLIGINNEFQTRATFEWTGEYIELKKDGGFARLYILKNIDKITL